MEGKLLVAALIVVIKVNMKKYVAELLELLHWCFAAPVQLLLTRKQTGQLHMQVVAITFGLIVMSMIYALGNISGCHLNPAVTIAFTISRKISAKRSIALYSQPACRRFSGKCCLKIFVSAQ